MRRAGGRAGVSCRVGGLHDPALVVEPGETQWTGAESKVLSVRHRFGFLVAV